ncbi:MAG: hypothetical protein M0P31_02390 [Solirubrobacteraceae bacterium]|nr:hypothetical protein [Solirubrobacteraceae bacterium]
MRGDRTIDRRTAAALITAAVALVVGLALWHSRPSPDRSGPQRPAALADQPDAPGTIRAPSRSRVPEPASVLAAIGDDVVAWSPRGTGRILRGTVRGDRVVAPTLVAEVATAEGDREGVRGLAAGPDGRLYASYVRPAGRRLVVARVDVTPPAVVWRGPRTRRTRVGGGLGVLQGGRVVVGIGDQGRPAGARRSRRPYGRVVSLDPDGPPDQSPVRRSRGWHDPVALAVGPQGRIWVADRVGGGEPERLGRADLSRGAGRVGAPFRRDPVAVVATVDGRALLVCGGRSGRIDRTPVRGRGAGAVPTVLEARCRHGLTLLGGRAWVSDDAGRIVPLPGTARDLEDAPPVEGG